MYDLQSLQNFQPGPVSGDFRLRDASINETKDGRQYLRIFLEDMSGSLPAYIWKEEICRRFYLPNFSLVRIEGQSRYYDNLLRIDLHSIAPISCKRAGDVVRLSLGVFVRFPNYCQSCKLHLTASRCQHCAVLSNRYWLTTVSPLRLFQHRSV